MRVSSNLGMNDTLHPASMSCKNIVFATVQSAVCDRFLRVSGLVQLCLKGVVYKLE